MKKRISDLLLIFSAIISLGIFSSCDRGGDLAALLDTVPEDVPYVVTIQGKPVLDQLGFKKDGDRYTFDKSVQNVIDLSGADKKMVSRICELIDATGKNFVIFSEPTKVENVWFTFAIDDREEFIDRCKSIAKANGEKMDFDKDGDYMIDNSEHFVLSKNQAWVSSEKINLDDVEEFGKLKESFASANKELTERMVADTNVLSYSLNISALASIARNQGGAEEVAALQSALALLFDDATYIFGTTSLNNQGTESTVDVLNSKYAMAKFLLPVGKIDTAAMAKIDNNASVVAALAIPSELMEKITGLISTLNGGHLNPESSMVFGLLNSINGTLAASFNGPQDYIVSIPFKDAESATNLGQLISAAGNLNTSLAGNYLIIRSRPDVNGGGSAPAGFKGQTLAYAIDFSKVPETIITGADLSPLGKVNVNVGPFENGLRASSKWECDRPLVTLCTVVRKIAADYITGTVRFPFLESSRTYEEDYAWEPEPDYYGDEGFSDSVAGPDW